MSFAPRGNLLENTASLPSWVSVDVPTQSDSEEARIKSMYQSALREHLRAARAKVTKDSEISEEERSESRRVLTSRAEPWASTRRWLCECAELDEKAVRRAAMSILAPIIEAERAREAEHVESDHERKLRLKLADEFEAAGVIRGRGRPKLSKPSRDIEIEVPALAAE